MADVCSCVFRKSFIVIVTLSQSFLSVFSQSIAGLTLIAFKVGFLYKFSNKTHHYWFAEKRQISDVREIQVPYT